METETEKIIKGQIENLPQEVKSLLADPKTDEQILEIGKIHELNEDQQKILQMETFLLMLGLTHPDEYREELKNKLTVNEETLNDLVRDVNMLVTDEIVEKLEETYEEIEGKKEEVKITPDNKSYTLDPRFASLPMETQTAISKSDYQKNIYVIGEKYKLNIEQMGILEDITIQVMLNIIHPDKYEEILSSKITIGKDDITNLVKDINELVFKKIRSLEMEGGISSKEQVVSSKREEEIPLPPYVISSKEQVVSSGEDTSKGKEEIPNIMEDKLKGITASNQTTTDYSTPKIDPYREQF